MTAEEVLISLIELYSYYLEELNELPRDDFIHGEMTAYLETLERIQRWPDHKKYGLDYDLERKYKI